MPTSARQPCLKPRCQHDKPCPIHARKPWDHRGRTRQERGYGAGHERLRDQVLAEESCCRICRYPGQGTADHIIPLFQGGTTTRENMQRLCTRCQQAKASSEGNQSRREKLRVVG